MLFRFLFFMSFIILLKLSANAQDSTKTYVTIRIEKSPRIDGVLNDDIWKNAEIASSFVQYQPIEGAQPSQKTEVKLMYDNNAIYLSAMMFDPNAGNIQRELGDRDDLTLASDYFRLVIDPYNTRQDAYDFRVYASGIQADSKFSDLTYDAVWESAVKINAEGWALEMKIPYSAIRFPKKDIQKWGLQFTRSIALKNEFIQWNLTPSGVANPLAYWGTLTGLENIKSPLRLSLSPYLSSYVENTPVLNENGSTAYTNSFSYNAGADIKYGIDERFTLDMTLLPDFGQVQSDNKIKNLSYREVTYDENRPFFKESVELFSKDDLFYSRRIGKIPKGFNSLESQLNAGDQVKENPSQVKLLNATKLSGRNNKGMGIGLFNAITDDTYALVTDSNGISRKINTEPFTNYNVVVIDQQFKNNSSAYLINTNVARANKNPMANVTGTGFTYMNPKNTYAVDISAAMSKEIDSVDKEPGLKYFIGARKTSGNFQFGLSRTGINEFYNAIDMGYYTVNNQDSHNLYANYNFYKPQYFFRNSYNNFFLNYSTNHITGERTNLSLNLNLYATLMNYHAIFIGGGGTPMSSYDYNETRVASRYFKSLRYYYVFAGFNTDQRKKIFANIVATYSNFIDRFIDAGINTDVEISYRVSNRFSLSYKNSFNYDPFNVGFANFDTSNNIIFGGREINTYENSIGGKFIFKKDMSISVNTRHYWTTGMYKRYFTLSNDGELIDNSVYAENNDFNYNVFNIDLIYSWRFAPGSTLSIVYKNAIEQEQQLIIPHFRENFNQTIHSPQINSLSIKLLYYLDYQSLRKSKTA